MGLTLITPAENPVSLDDAKAWCRVDGAADDAALRIALNAAFEQAQTICGRALGVQTWKLVLDAFSPAIELSKGPVTGISAFNYVGIDGLEHTVDAGIYTLDLVSDPQWIVLNSDDSWPDTLDAINVVSITYETGYADLPAPIKAAILMQTAEWFDRRSGVEVSASLRNLLRPYRRLRI